MDTSGTHVLSVPKPQCLLKPIHVPHVKLLGPGPTNMTQRVAKSLHHSLLGPMDDSYLKIMNEIQEGLQYLFQTSSPYVLCIPGVGHAGLEAAISNLMEPGETIAIGIQGIWGERALEVAERQGLNVIQMRIPPGEVFKMDDIKNILETHKPTALYMTHVESSACILQDVTDIGNLCHRYGAFSIVDVVASVIATPFLMDEWGVDIAYTATQKALSAPPGLAPMALSRNAMNKIKARKTKPTTFYMDIAAIANYWSCDGEVRRYHHTCPVNIGYALRESLADVVTKGLEWHWKRQIRVRDMFAQGMEQLGYKLFVKDKALRAPTMTAIVIPEGVDWRKVVRLLVEEYQIQILGGLGPTAGKILRVGFIGPNCDEKLVQLTLGALHSTLQKLTLRNNL